MTQSTNSMPRPRTKSPVSNLKPVRRKRADGTVAVDWYFRGPRGGLVRLTHDPNSAQGLQEIAKLERRANAAGGDDASLSGLIEGFKASPRWRELEPSTRKRYEETFDYLGPVATKILPETMRRKQVTKLADKAAEVRGFRFGQLLVANLSALFSWAISEDLIERNPCKGARRPARPKDLPDANRPWTFPELAEVWRASADAPGLRAFIVLELFCGVRGQDVRRIEWPAYVHVDGETDADPGHGRILGYRTMKNAEAVDVIIPQPFAGFLESLPGYAASVGPIAVSSRGTAWTASGAQRALERVRAPLEVAGKIGPGLTFHGLRHTLAVFGRESGLGDRGIADLINDKTTAMALTYSRGAAKRETGDPVRLALAGKIGHMHRPDAENLEHGMEQNAGIQPPAE